VERANIFGLGSIEAANPEHGDRCIVLIARDYYGPHTRTQTATDTAHTTIVFECAAAAQAWIDNAESLVYHTKSGETGQPTYKVIALD
jgi:hypothetical protein